MPREPMSCAHEAGDLLFLHVAGRLDGEPCRQVEEHLRTCTDCVERLDLLRWMQRRVATAGAALFADHVAADLLLAYCGQPESLTPASSAAVREHLALCRACADEAATVREVDATLAAGATGAESPGVEVRAPGSGARATAGTAGATGARRRRGWLAALAEPFRALPRLSPAPAYIALAVLLVPALVGVQQLVGLRADRAPSPRIPPVSVQAPVLLRGGAQRGAAEIPVVRPAAGGAVTVLFHSPVAWSPAVRYDCRLVAADGTTVWRGGDVEGAAPNATFVLTLRVAQLRPARYRIVLEEVHRETGETVNVFEYPFELELTR